MVTSVLCAVGAPLAAAPAPPSGAVPARSAAAALVLLALAAAVWPAARGVGTLRRVESATGRVGRPRRTERRLRTGGVVRWWPLAAAGGAAGAAAALGTSVAVAAGLVAGTVGTLVRVEAAQVRTRRARAAVLLAVRTLARELHAGAPPDRAVLAAAQAHPGPGEQALLAVSAAIAVGDRPLGDRRPPGVGARASGADRRRTGRATGAVDPVTTAAARLTGAWVLAARHGVPWSRLVETTADDLEEAVRSEDAARAQSAGPRMSGYVLAVLPALGLLLGAGMGADPVHVLLRTPIGGVLLLAGTALTCAGLAWTARIVRR
ncbi:type II secretion system F family protein [Nakamurella endophytica]|uniref:Tight adherence protein B n=1 Tax=Nakamurella endophytica TaxID=1748367 RepID=A0A917WGP6_9ACTN|nr:type II secretion system F family protein [Nakamurella endophytica]GGM05347.1 hypothetical protein GCM10011594_26970 [Nakamurella endophytica]